MYNPPLLARLGIGAQQSTKILAWLDRSNVQDEREEQAILQTRVFERDLVGHGLEARVDAAVDDLDSVRRDVQQGRELVTGVLGIRRDVFRPTHGRRYDALQVRA